MYESAEGNQFITVMPDKEVLFNEIRNRLYYHDTEGCAFGTCQHGGRKPRRVLLQRDFCGQVGHV